MPKKRKTGGNIVAKILKPILQRTRIASRTLKMLQPKGSPIYNFGEHLHQKGYGWSDAHYHPAKGWFGFGQTSSLVGRLRLN